MASRDTFTKLVRPRPSAAQHLAEADPLSASLVRGKAGRRGSLCAGDSAAQLTFMLRAFAGCSAPQATDDRRHGAWCAHRKSERIRREANIIRERVLARRLLVAYAITFVDSETVSVLVAANVIAALVLATEVLVGSAFVAAAFVLLLRAWRHRAAEQFAKFVAHFVRLSATDVGRFSS